MRTKFELFVLFIIVSVAASCGSSNEKPTENVADSTVVKDTLAATNPIDEEKEFKFLQIIANIPAPSKEVLEIAKSGFKYNSKLVNNAANAEKYETTFKKAINYGVCLSDLAYTASFGNTQDVLIQFSAAKILAEGASALATFEKVVTQAHFEDQLKNMNVDTVERIIDNIYTATDEYLTNDHHLDIASKILVGSWIENQYLALNTINGVKMSPSNEKLFDQLWSQKLHLANINKLMAEYADNEEMNKVAQKLTEFEKAYYTDLSDVKGLTKEKITGMQKAISVIRSEIVAL